MLLLPDEGLIVTIFKTLGRAYEPGVTSLLYMHIAPSDYNTQTTWTANNSAWCERQILTRLKSYPRVLKAVISSLPLFEQPAVQAGMGKKISDALLHAGISFSFF